LREIVLIADMQIGMTQGTENHIAKAVMVDITDRLIEMAVSIGMLRQIWV